MVFKDICIVVLWSKLASALEGLKSSYIFLLQTTEGCLVQAGKLAVSAGPAPSLPPATDADIQRGLEEEQRRNQTNLDIYHELVATLVTLVEGGTL